MNSNITKIKTLEELPIEVKQEMIDYVNGFNKPNPYTEEIFDEETKNFADLKEAILDMGHVNESSDTAYLELNSYDVYHFFGDSIFIKNKLIKTKSEWDNIFENVLGTSYDYPEKVDRILEYLKKNYQDSIKL